MTSTALRVICGKHFLKGGKTLAYGSAAEASQHGFIFAKHFVWDFGTPFVQELCARERDRGTTACCPFDGFQNSCCNHIMSAYFTALRGLTKTK